MGVKFVLTDGASHMVDSSDWAFHQATQTAIGKNHALKIRSSDIVIFNLQKKIFSIYVLLKFPDFILFCYLFMYRLLLRRCQLDNFGTNHVSRS